MIANESHRWQAENEPLALGPVLRVSTAEPVDLTAPVEWITRHWNRRTTGA